MIKSHVPEYLIEEENTAENISIAGIGTALRKKDSGLPANLYLDDTGSWRGSGCVDMIKFQANKNNFLNTRLTASMSISDNPQILARSPRMNLSSKDIEQIRNFVKQNKDLLLRLSRAEIDILEFYDEMKTA